MGKKDNPDEDPDPTDYLFVSLETRMKDKTKPYDPKVDCWVPDEEEGYIIGQITGTDGEMIKVRTSRGESSFEKDVVDQANPPKCEKCEDMADLTILNDPSVLHNLRARFSAKLIYTYSGLFCVAINPYERFPIYTSRAMKIYTGRRRNEVPPHIFAVAESAYQNMQQDRENQSILITGESGAGKTVNTKKIIAYFASISGGGKKKKEEQQRKPSSAAPVENGGGEVPPPLEEEDEPAFVSKISLEDQIVQTNPVLESFGNAKTTRNDNSSRFGKFIRIHFGPSGKLAGADIENYLLEKARTISQMAAERCYHIFYQLMSTAAKEAGVKDLCKLGDDIKYYHFVSQGMLTVPSIDDNEEFLATHEAFDILNFGAEARDNIYKITASVMHMGEMKFKQKGREEQAEPDGMEDGTNVAELVGVDPEEFYKNICKPKIKVGSEFVIKGQNVEQCYYTMGAMAKSIYDRLFKFLVKKCNDTLDTKQKRQHFAGVLDIAGFEIFEENGFDQICINFTNEKLQQFFNHHMFVQEQEEYKKEGLDWVFQDFGMDLQACIECFEQKMGIFSILEEQSLFPKATDKSFEEMLKDNLMGKSPVFIKPKPSKPGEKTAHFGITHYAGTVMYNLTGWLEKNKDPVNDTVVDQWKKGSNALVVLIYDDHPGQSPPDPAKQKKMEEEAKAAGGKKGKKGGFKTVSSSYKEQLNNLMTTLRATHPHFIRCIIPNELKSPGILDCHLVMHQLQCNGVLQGIRVCRKGFPNRIIYEDFKNRYYILAQEQINTIKDDKQMATAVFDHIGLEKEKYRVGHTKVFFRAGALGDLEEIRDEMLIKRITQIQAHIRTFVTRKKFKQDQEQRIALSIVQRNIKQYMRMKTWKWYNILQKLKPVIASRKVEDQMNSLGSKADELEAAIEREKELIIDFDNKILKTEGESKELEQLLAEERSRGGNLGQQVKELLGKRDDLEIKLKETEARLKTEEEAVALATSEKKKSDQELQGLKKEVEAAELALQKLEQDKNSKDQQIRYLNEEIGQRDELINRLTKEKKQIQDLIGKLEVEMTATDDKVKHLSRLKSKMDKTLKELDNNLEKEKAFRSELERTKRRIEGDLKLAHEAFTDLERNRKELEQVINRKDKEMQNFISKLEDEQTFVSKLQKQVKELQLRIEELEADLEAERGARGKTDKQRMDLARDLDELSERLDEAGGVTIAQMELNKKKDAEVAKLRRDIEQANIQHEAAMAGMRKTHNDAVAEMTEHVDTLNKLKTRAEKETAKMVGELNDIRNAMDHLSNDKISQEKLNKQWQFSLCDLQAKFQDASNAMQELEGGKNKLMMDNSELAKQLEDCDTQICQLNKLKLTLVTELDDLKRLADEETRERGILLGKFKTIEHDHNGLREQLDEEGEAKADLLRQFSKASAEAQLWRAKYESEGIARTEELEEAKRKLQSRLAEAEETVKSLNEKVLNLEKNKQRLSTELEDMRLEVERSKGLVTQMEKKQKQFDKIAGEWKQKREALTNELDNCQKDCRNYSTEMFKLQTAYDENQGHIESLRRDNKGLIEEIRDLMEKMGEGGRAIHEIDKTRRRLGIEKEELQAALEEAEAALEQEENKLLNGQFELAQVRQEIDRRIQEKEDEFECCRKIHQRALESMQASLEAEAKAKAEALRMKKKLEGDINELEMALDASNKANTEAQKGIKRYQQQLKETQQSFEEEQRSRDEMRDALGQAERRSLALTNELEESRTLLEQADRGRRNAEQELADANDQLHGQGAIAAGLSSTRRKLESELQTLHGDLEEILNEAKLSDDKAKKAMIDAARLADELRAEQDNAITLEKLRKGMELQMKDLQTKLSEVEGNQLRGGKKAVAKLEERIRGIEQELDGEQRRHADTQKNLKKNERKIKEISFQADEDKKNHVRMQELVDGLQQKIKTYKRQIEEAEEIAALNLSKFRKAQHDLEGAEERSGVVAQTLVKIKSVVKAPSVVKTILPEKKPEQPIPMPTHFQNQ